VRRRPRSHTRLYFFPALLPLGELVPLLLTGVAALAGFVSRLSRQERRRRITFGLAAACALVALGLGIRFWVIRMASFKGSRLTATQDLPKTEIYSHPKASSSSTQASGRIAVLSGQPFRLTEKFYVLLPRLALSSPVATGKQVLIGTRQGTLDAFDSDTGELQWSMRKREPVLSVAAPDESRGFGGEGLHETGAAGLTAFNVATGAALWQREFASHVEMAPLFESTTRHLWVSTGALGLWCLDARDGNVLWRAPIGHADVTPSRIGNTLYVSAAPDEKIQETFLHALDPERGRILWKTRLPGQPWGIAIGGARPDRILVSTATGKMGPVRPNEKGWAHAIDAATGAIAWTTELPGMGLMRPEILHSKGLVFYTLKNGSLVALDTESGKVRWTTRYDDGEFQAPASLHEVRGHRVLAVASTRGSLYLINPDDGRSMVRMQISAGSTSSPVFAGDTLFVATPSDLSAYQVEAP
jgi:outer membrane protein assembly factor BamB